MNGRVLARLIRIALWVIATVAVVASVIEVTRGRCGPGESRGDLVAPAALSVGVATCAAFWRQGRAVRAMSFGIALGVGVGALLFLFGLFSWVHDCAN